MSTLRKAKLQKQFLKISQLQRAKMKQDQFNAAAPLLTSTSHSRMSTDSGATRLCFRFLEVALDLKLRGSLGSELGGFTAVEAGPGWLAHLGTMCSGYVYLLFRQVVFGNDAPTRLEDDVDWWALLEYSRKS